MPEVHVQQELVDEVMGEDEKAQKVDELRKMIEGKFSSPRRNLRQCGWEIDINRRH